MPQEIYETKIKPKPFVYKLIDISSVAIIVAGSAIGIYIIFSGKLTFFILGILIMAVGAALIFPGWLSKGIEGLIREIDDFFPIFIRSYALNYETLPNQAKALRPMLIVELGKLSRILENLYARLLNGIDPSIAWRMVANESRSELVRRFLRIFIDAIEKGGKISVVGASLSDHHNLIVRLRRNRLQVAKTFETTTYIMQGAIVIINVFVVSLLNSFSHLLTSMQAQIPANIVGPLFGSQIPLAPIIYMSAIFSIVTAVMNAFSITRVTPGVSRTFWYYLGILLLISGIGIILGSAMMEYILGSTVQALSNLTTSTL
ncbi:MAG: type II secretion system F family protein [Fervidicoccaceae archaeon]